MALLRELECSELRHKTMSHAKSRQNNRERGCVPVLMTSKWKKVVNFKSVVHSVWFVWRSSRWFKWFGSGGRRRWQKRLQWQPNGTCTCFHFWLFSKCFFFLSLMRHFRFRIFKLNNKTQFVFILVMQCMYWAVIARHLCMYGCLVAWLSYILFTSKARSWLRWKMWIFLLMYRTIFTYLLLTRSLDTYHYNFIFSSVTSESRV